MSLVRKCREYQGFTSTKLKKSLINLTRKYVCKYVWVIITV